MTKQSVNITSLTISKTHDDGSKTDYMATADTFDDGQKVIAVREGDTSIYIPLDVWLLLKDRIDALVEIQNQ